MADLKYDVVICGGGNKALMLAMYLTKFAGMRCGIFERRHEIGGGLATEEIAAPGFRGNTHANLMLPWYWTPLYRDFPEFWDYGGMIDQYKCSDGAIFLDTQKCLGIYSQKFDPTQERTAEQIARFSQKDADTWLKLWKLTSTPEYQRVLFDDLMNPAEWKTRPEYMERQMGVFNVIQEAGIDPMPYMGASPMEAVRMMFESEELQYTVLRFFPSSVMNVRDKSKGMLLLGMANMLPQISFARGGTHMVAHACHQWLTKNGCEFHINKTVTKILHDGKRASGIELHDGTQVDASKLVVTAGLSVMQLLDVIGRDVFGSEICSKVDNLSHHNLGSIMWYSYAIHEAPRYIAEDFNPDIHETMWLGLTTSSDLEHLGRECDEATKGQIPAIGDFNPVVWCHSLVDPSFAPPGKHIAQHEMQAPGAQDLTDDEWLRLKDKHAEDMIEFWSKFAPNMNWSNVIGIDTNSPYDIRRMANLPYGNCAGIDKSSTQDGPNRPVPELANHRTPIQNVYCTGGYWHVGGTASAAEAYNCYKIIASDLKLDNQPWTLAGNEEPDSLIDQQVQLVERVRNTFRV
ncbi:conserved protein of unknown function [Sterolibacterium denitrificans]|uniref:Pyridine nucleotide-disulfide oxidoreductase domain-containing protein 2 n=1 Tax=Sterolibacterium denitrificans TaxID=157592 RepID=A0A7Z7HR23_9PROT|nr:NAD(P)/FAD-dependent oxidoreductase [Sterolibacterium denitrificans]SMB26547.1 conserved protein of unknown function [Sterolibacterium denitrificans]